MLYNQGLSTDPTATDSIAVDLWSPLNLNAAAYSAQAIVHHDGTATVSYDGAVLGNSFYIVVRNRNALETWSKYPVLFNNVNISFDFTSP